MQTFMVLNRKMYVTELTCAPSVISSDYPKPYPPSLSPPTRILSQLSTLTKKMKLESPGTYSMPTHAQENHTLASLNSLSFPAAAHHFLPKCHTLMQHLPPPSSRTYIQGLSLPNKNIPLLSAIPSDTCS